MTATFEVVLEKYWSRVLGIVLAVSALLHVTSLSLPREVIFDEVHFGKFISAYCCTHERFFDIHPPHAKLIIAGAARLAGYDDGFSFEHIGLPYTTQPVWALRLVPALTGTVLPLVIMLLLRQLGASRLLSLLGGLAVLLDNALTVQTRVIALDGVLLLATFGSVSAYLAAAKREGVVGWSYVVLAGALAGLAAGTKFTGLAALALLGVLTLVWLVQAYLKQGETAWQWVVRGVVVLVSAVAIYLLGWAAHYQLVYLPGPGDAWYVPTGNFVSDTVAWHKKMLDANYNLQAGHPNASPWWSWPVMGRSVFYWEKAVVPGKSAFVYFLGNPVMWWGSSALFVAGLIAAVVRFGQRARPATRAQSWIPLAGFFIAMLPLLRVPRALFLYHYLTPLLFALIFGVLWLEASLSEQSVFRRRFVVGAVIMLLLGFVWIAPLTYGIPVPASLQPFVFVFDGWR